MAKRVTKDRWTDLWLKRLGAAALVALTGGFGWCFRQLNNVEKLEQRIGRESESISAQWESIAKLRTAMEINSEDQFTRTEAWAIIGAHEEEATKIRERVSYLEGMHNLRGVK